MAFYILDPCVLLLEKMINMLHISILKQSSEKQPVSVVVYHMTDGVQFIEIVSFIETIQFEVPKLYD